MLLSEIKVSGDLQELTPHKTPDLPMQVYLDDYGRYLLRCVNWHWHRELEFAVVLSGRLRYAAGSRELVLGPGEGVFVNAQILHMAEPLTPPEETTAFSICFSPDMIASANQGAAYHKYVAGPLANARVSCLGLVPSTPWQREALELLDGIYRQDERKEFGYELFYHRSLLEIWRLLCVNTDICRVPDEPEKERSGDRRRINAMLDYIKANYGQEMTVRDIAASANISKSECYRCFQHSIRAKPFEFLLAYRVERASIALCSTDKPVTQIASECGFNSPSYFGTVFRAKTGQTPSAYRAACRRAQPL